MMTEAASLPRITIVTPSYNQGDYIEATIQSVLNQGYPNLEYIVMDGGSNDQSVEIIQRYADKLAYWVSEPDRGQTHAINKGFERSTGDILGWLNSDDVLLPGALHQVANVFQRNPQVNIVTGMRKIINPRGKFVANLFRGIPTNDILRYYCPIMQETTFWRRKVWEDVGALNEERYYIMDYDYWQRMIQAGYEFTFLPQYLGGFRHQPESKGTKAEAVRQQEIAQMYQAYGIATDEADALRKLNAQVPGDWQTKIDLLKALGHFSISENPRVMVAVYRLLMQPGIGQVLDHLYRFYRSRRDS